MTLDKLLKRLDGQSVAVVVVVVLYALYKLSLLHLCAALSLDVQSLIKFESDHLFPQITSEQIVCTSASIR